MTTWMMAMALGGYGDPVAGVPLPEGRALHLWTNAARVEPDAFEADYAAGGCSYYTDFSANEQTPKVPLRHDVDLMEAADVHTLDMFFGGFLSHDSSDGTDFATRVWSYYPGGAIGENIAVGYGSPRNTVMVGWMCSTTGHRGAIMSSTYDDLGGSMHGAYATLDFGAQGGASPELRVAAHEDDGSSISLYGVVGSGGPTDGVEFVVDGGIVGGTLLYGDDENGVYGAQVPDDGACHEYYARAWYGGTEVRYPEDGSYGWGPCAWDDVDAQWVDRQMSPVSPPSLSSDAWSVGAAVDVSAADLVPGSTAHFVAGTADGLGPCPGALGGLCLQVSGTVKYLGSAVADGGGEAVLSLVVPAGASGRTLYLQAAGDGGAGWALSNHVVQVVP